MSFLSRLTHPPRRESAELETAEEIDAYIDSRALEYPTKIEDEFVQRGHILHDYLEARVMPKIVGRG